MQYPPEIGRFAEPGKTCTKPYRNRPQPTVNPPPVPRSIRAANKQSGIRHQPRLKIGTGRRERVRSRVGSATARPAGAVSARASIVNTVGLWPRRGTGSGYLRRFFSQTSSMRCPAMRRRHVPALTQRRKHCPVQFRWLASSRQRPETSKCQTAVFAAAGTFASIKFVFLASSGSHSTRWPSQLAHGLRPARANTQDFRGLLRGEWP